MVVTIPQVEGFILYLVSYKYKWAHLAVLTSVFTQGMASNCPSLAVVIPILAISGAYEPPKVAKEHETWFRDNPNYVT